MPGSIADAVVALSLMREALKLLDAIEDSRAAVHLRCAIDELIKRRPEDLSIHIENPDEP